MWKVSQCISMVLLAVLSITDIHSRRIPVIVLISGNLAVLCYQIYIAKEDVFVLAGGIGVGLLFLLVSRVTREGMGYGDSWTILILGIYLGLWKLLEVLLAAFLLLWIAAIIFLSLNKISREYNLPFIPFLAAGYLFSILTGGMNG